MLKVNDFVKKPKWNHITWLWKKETWVNDRVECGPFTTKTRDRQGDIVVMGKDRLGYIFKFGHLIYEHHLDPMEPVVILGDCLAIGHDQMGKTYGVWGWYDGTETVDKAWEESKDWGETAGYSIGGKKTDVDCEGGTCTLTDPETLEVSKTKTPANTECTVHYINTLAKNLVNKAKEHPGNYGSELNLASREIDRKIAERFRVDSEYDLDQIINTRKCAKEYVWGLQEVSNGMIKSDNARLMLDDKLHSIKKKVENDMEQEAFEKMMAVLTKMDEKLTKMGEYPAGGQMDSGNVVLELLGEIRDSIAAMSGKGESAPAPEEPQQEDTPVEPNGLEDEPEPEGDDGTSDEEEEPEEEKKKKEIEKTEGEMDMGYPEGENPEPEGPNADLVEDPPEIEDVGLPEGENPDPEGPPTELDEDVTDKGDESHDMGYPSDNEGAEAEISEEAVGPEDQNKDETEYSKQLKGKLAVRPKKTNLEDLMKSDGFLMVKGERMVKHDEDPNVQIQTHGKDPVSRTGTKSVYKSLLEGKGEIKVEK